MKMILIILLLFLQPKFSDALTFKRDGSVVSSSGVILKKSNAEKYQKALELFNIGQGVEDWPISNNNRKYRGYFGETMLRQGAPLFSIGKVSEPPTQSNQLNRQPTNSFFRRSHLQLKSIAT